MAKAEESVQFSILHTCIMEPIHQQCCWLPVAKLVCVLLIMYIVSLECLLQHDETKHPTS